MLLAIGVLSFVWVALYNGYPLVYADSGTYLWSSVTLDSPGDRPLFYGLFLRITNMQAHNWVPIIVQGIIGGWLVLRLTHFFFKDSPFLKTTFVFIVLGVFTGSSWYASQLMPDIFTSFGVLSLFLYFFDNTNKAAKYFYLLVLFLSSSVHLSNPLIFVSCILTLFLLNLLSKKPKLIQSKFKFIISLGIAISVFPIQAWINYAQKGEFSISPEGNLFHIAKATESGMFQIYVRENKDRIYIPFAEESMNLKRNPCYFLWDSQSPVNNGKIDRIKLSKLYAPVLKDMFSKWKYQKMFLQEVFRSGSEQLKFYKIGSGLHSYTENTPPYWHIETEFESEFESYKNAKQYKIGLEQIYPENLSRAVHISSWLILAILLLLRRIRKKIGILVFILIIGVVANALVTGGLANVYDRLAVRVNWLLTFGAIIGFLVLIESYFETKKGKKHYL